MMVAGGSRSDISVDPESTLWPRLDVREETNVETTFLATTGVLMYFFCSVIRL